MFTLSGLCVHRTIVICRQSFFFTRYMYPTYYASQTAVNKDNKEQMAAMNDINNHIASLSVSWVCMLACLLLFMLMLYVGCASGFSDALSLSSLMHTKHKSSLSFTLHRMATLRTLTIMTEGWTYG